jgi:hypothetical protein
MWANAMTSKFSDPSQKLQSHSGVPCMPNPPGGHVPLHQHYVPNFKGKSKSRAASHNMEFLSRVFASDGASRFFKTFLLRFLFDSGKASSEDCSAGMTPAV